MTVPSNTRAENYIGKGSFLKRNFLCKSMLFWSITYACVLKES